nr:hypothetical protein [Nanoarchaeota archaeon]
MLLIKPNPDITDQDIQNGKKSLEEFLIKPRTPENTEKGLIYAILTRGNQSITSKKRMERAEKDGLTALKYWVGLGKKYCLPYIRNIRFYNGVWLSILDSYYYLENNKDWFEQIRTNPYELRDDMDKNIGFMGLKIASLWLKNCGQNFVAIDRKILKYIRDQGFEYNKFTPKGKLDVVHFSKKDYQRAEDFIIKLVNNDKRFHGQDYQPLALFDATIWSR